MRSRSKTRVAATQVVAYMENHADDSDAAMLYDGHQIAHLLLYSQLEMRMVYRILAVTSFLRHLLMCRTAGLDLFLRELAVHVTLCSPCNGCLALPDCPTTLLMCHIDCCCPVS